jgi:hypothetical protein
MVTDAKLGLQNGRHDAMSGRFGLLVRGVRSGDTDCAGPDNCQPNRNHHYDELADAAGHDRLHLWAHSIAGLIFADVICVTGSRTFLRG